MAWNHKPRHLLAAIGIAFGVLAGSAMPVTAAAPAPLGDVLSGRWKVSRSCLTICTSPPPSVKTVHRVKGSVYTTDGQPPQYLYQLGRQVLVHGPKDSLLLTLDPHGRLMTGDGVGADGSTFKTTWRCVSPRPTPSATQAMSRDGLQASGPGHAPLAMEAC
jgi:hypothetical protein